MALTAWETCVEDRVREEIETRLRIVNGSYLGDFVLNRLEDDTSKAKKALDDLISKRGDAVHRSKPAQAGMPAPHLVKRDELEKAIRFLKDLIKAADKALLEN